MKISTKFLIGVSLSSLLTTDAFAAVNEIIVTSRKRAESIQSVPLAITTFSGEDLARAGVEDLRDLSNLVAGLQFDGFGNRNLTTPQIRGLSQVSRIDDENNVSIFVDGIYVSGREGLDFGLIDLERVEVVKGPQSALYGRNSYGGAINYITKKPGDSIEASATFTIGNDGKRTVKGGIGGPISDGVLGARIAGAYDTFDGSYDNPLSSDNPDYYEQYFFNGSLVFTPTENFSATLTGYYLNDENGPSAQYLSDGNCETYGGSVLQEFCGEVPSVGDVDLPYDPRAFGLEREIGRIGLNLRWEHDWGAIVSNTGHNMLWAESLVDQDRQLDGATFFSPTFSPVPNVPQFVAFTNAAHIETIQEIRIESNEDQRVRWMAGGSYYQLERKDTPALLIDADPGDLSALYNPFLADIPLGIDGDGLDRLQNFQRNRKETETWAAFGSVEGDVTDSVTARAELRYTSESKTATNMVLEDLGLPGAEFGDETFKFWTPRFTVDWQVNDDALLYASAARGAKAGGFNSSSTPPQFLAFDPETNWTYEIGAKTDWLDGDLRINVAAFYIDMEDIQITNQITGTALFATQNSGTGTSKGFEIEVSATPVDGLDLSINYAFADATFDDATDGSFSSAPGDVMDLIDSGVVPSVLAPDGVTRVADLSGQRLPRTSEHTLNGTIQYSQSLNDTFDWFTRIDTRYESEQKGDTLDALSKIGDRVVTNIRGGVSSEKLDFTLWVDNAFDDDTPVLVSGAAQLNDFTGRPVFNLPTLRTFGATLTLRY